MNAIESLTSLLSIPSIVFLAMEILILLIGVLLGLKRGLGRTAVRATYLVIIAVLSLLIARGIANNVADIVPTFARTVLATEAPEAIEIMDMAPDLEVIAAHLVGALLVPICFATLFVIFQVLSLIFFKKASVAIVTAVTNNDEKPSWSKWAGAGAGFVLSLIVAAIVLSPLYTVVAIVENTPESTIYEFSEVADATTAEADMSTTALKVTVIPTNASMRVTNLFFINNFVTEKLTTYKIPNTLATEDDRESLVHFIPTLFETAADAFTVYATTGNAGGEEIDAITNALSAVVPHLGDSVTLKHIFADGIRVLGQSFRENGSFMGLTLPETDNAIVNSLIKNIVKTCAETDASSVMINMSSLFGLYDTIDFTINRGLLASMLKLDQDDPKKSLADEKLAGAVSDAIGNMADNANMADVVTDIKDFAVGLLQDSDINLSDEKYNALYEKISKDLSEQLTIHVGTVEPSDDDKGNEGDGETTTQTTATVAEVAKSLEDTIGGYFEEYDVQIDSFQTSVIATCIAQEFYKEENIVDGSINISVDDVLEFFGISQDDINNFLGGGDATDIPGVDIPEGVDPSDLLEGVDIPDDFDPSDLPEGFDPSDYLPETEG